MKKRFSNIRNKINSLLISNKYYVSISPSKKNFLYEKNYHQIAVDPDGKNFEAYANGFRNIFDAAFNRDGELINRLGAPLPGEHPDQFLWPHSVAVDSHGDIYVAEVSYVEVGSKENPPREMVSLRKWQRISD